MEKTKYIKYKNIMRCFVIGNGESRRAVDLEGLKQYGQTWMCNAAYRDNTPDRLVSIDIEICHLN